MHIRQNLRRSNILPPRYAPLVLRAQSAFRRPCSSLSSERRTLRLTPSPTNSSRNPPRHRSGARSDCQLTLETIPLHGHHGPYAYENCQEGVYLLLAPMAREWMGSSLMAYYSSVLRIGARPSLVSLLPGVLNIFFALGCVPLYFTIERGGRRSVLLYSAMAMTVLIPIFSILIAISPTPSIQWASIGVMFIFLFVFGYAWQGCV